MPSKTINDTLSIIDNFNTAMEALLKFADNYPNATIGDFLEANENNEFDISMAANEAISNMNSDLVIKSNLEGLTKSILYFAFRTY